MVTAAYYNRLANNIIQWLAGYVIAKQHKLHLMARPGSAEGGWAGEFQFPQYCNGQMKTDEHGNDYNAYEDNEVVVTDRWLADTLKACPMGARSFEGIPVKSYSEVLNGPQHHGKIHLCGWFQTPELLHDRRHEWVHLFQRKMDILPKPEPEFKDVYVHYRLGDLAWNYFDQREAHPGRRRFTLPIEHYIECLDMIKPRGGYISSDFPKHEYVLELARRYNLRVYDDGAVKTMHFAQHFDNLVLSEGTYSGFIGLICDDHANVFCSGREKRWHPDVNMPHWQKVYWDWTEESQQSRDHLDPIRLRDPGLVSCLHAEHH